MTEEEKAQQYAELRAERARLKKGELAYRGVKYLYGCPIVKLENRAFGWHFEGKELSGVGYELNASGTALRRKFFDKLAYFSRPKVWPKNFLTIFTETVARIFSFFRRIAFSFFWLPILIYIGMIFVGAAQGTIDNFKTAVLGVYIGLTVGSFILIGLGFLWQKVFKLREKCDHELEANGYIAWTENAEGDHF